VILAMRGFYSTILIHISTFERSTVASRQSAIGLACNALQEQRNEIAEWMAKNKFPEVPTITIAPLGHLLDNLPLHYEIRHGNALGVLAHLRN